MLLACLTLLHVFVLVFWVGGDLGAYYASYPVADPNQPPAARRVAARMISNIDMAPRTSLVLALPTGLTLAVAKGWLDLGGGWLVVAWAAGLAWLYVVWAVHLREPKAGSLLTRADLGLRMAAIGGFTLTGAAAVAGLIAVPAFIGLKLILLAAAITFGLIIRRVLPPFAVAFTRVLNDPTDDQAQVTVAGLLVRVRRYVVGIWVTVSLAGLIGIWQPVL